MIMTPWTVFISGFAGLVGLIVGVIVSTAAAEELAGARRWLEWFLDAFFALAVGVATFILGPIVMVVSVLTALLLVRSFKGLEKLKTVVFVMHLILILSWPFGAFTTIAGLFLLTGIVSGGVWSALHQKLAGEGLFRKQLWAALVRECALFFILPLAAVVIAV